MKCNTRINGLKGQHHHSIADYFLTHFRPMFHFYAPWKLQKTFGFLTFSGGIEIKHWTKMDYKIRVGVE